MGWRRWGALVSLWLVARPAAAQSGSIQVVSAAQVTTGDAFRLGDQPRLEPDVGIVVFRPGLPFGTLELDLHLTRRRERPHLGRSVAVLRGPSQGEFAWRVELGDTALVPAGTDYGFANLVAPPLVLTGLAAELSSRTTRVHLAAGRATALRNLFGTDPETLGQLIVAARLVHRIHPRVQLFGRASGVRTTDLAEFGYTVEAGRDIGAGFVVALRPQLEIVAEAGLNRYRRRGAPASQRGPSALLGTRWVFARGSLQVNAQHFSPGQFPALNMPFHDRRGAFGSGELDLTGALRLFASVDAVRTNLSPHEARLVPGTTPPAEQVRALGGVRLRLASRSFLTVRAERGARLTRPGLSAFAAEEGGSASESGRVDSQADVAALEWQSGFGRWHLVGRAERRSHVQVGGAALASTEEHGALQVFRPLSSWSHLFASALITRRQTAGRGDERFWEAHLGGQMRLGGSNLHARAEVTAARTYDFERNLVTTRRALGLGLTGQLSAETQLALHVFVDRTPLLGLQERSPWTTRTLLRVSRTIPTRVGVRPVRPAASLRRAGGGATGTVTALAYADWNANGAPDPDEEPVAGVTIALGRALAQTGADGRAAFVEVPAGPALVALDPTGVPATFDPPADPARSVTVTAARPAAVAFPLVPLGGVHGRVLHDGNGQPDPSDPPIDEAVVVLDGGQRSELVRAGRFRFEAVRAGRHEATLLLDSLGPGTAPVGEVTHLVEVTRERPEPEVVFLVRPARRDPASVSGAPRRAAGPAGGYRAARAAARWPARAAGPAVRRARLHRPGVGDARRPLGQAPRGRARRQGLSRLRGPPCAAGRLLSSARRPLRDARRSRRARPAPAGERRLGGLGRPTRTDAPA
jgi:hypothetical protein